MIPRLLPGYDLRLAVTAKLGTNEVIIDIGDTPSPNERRALLTVLVNSPRLLSKTLRDAVLHELDGLNVQQRKALRAHNEAERLKRELAWAKERYIAKTGETDKLLVTQKVETAKAKQLGLELSGLQKRKYPRSPRPVATRKHVAWDKIIASGKKISRI